RAECAGKAGGGGDARVAAGSSGSVSDANPGGAVDGIGGSVMGMARGWRSSGGGGRARAGRVEWGGSERDGGLVHDGVSGAAGVERRRGTGNEAEADEGAAESSAGARAGLRSVALSK